MRKSTLLIMKILILVAIILFGYLFYVFVSYERLPRSSELTASRIKSATASYENDKKIITIYSQDIGFGAFNREFSFVLNGGADSGIKNEILLNNNMDQITKDADFSRSNIILFQNVDINSNRSMNKDLSGMICGDLPNYGYFFAQNYNTPFLLYPPLNPVGKTQSGILTLYNIAPSKAFRNGLPFPNSLLKYIDLDTCYSLYSMGLGDGKTLWVYNVQLSPLTDEQTKTQQVQKLFEDMSEKYANGDYVVCGGTFYYDLTGDSAITLNLGKTVQEAGWAKPFPKELLPAGFAYAEPSNKNIATTRDPGIPYTEGTFIAITDGYFVSDNVEVLSSNTEDKQFYYSNHNAVVLKIAINRNNS